jgi:hypothetical protein
MRTSVFTLSDDLRHFGYAYAFHKCWRSHNLIKTIYMLWVANQMNKHTARSMFRI